MMKVIFSLVFTAVYLTATLVYSGPVATFTMSSSPAPMNKSAMVSNTTVVMTNTTVVMTNKTVSASNSSRLITIVEPTTPKPTKNCNFQLKRMDNIVKAVLKCTMTTGFVRNFLTNGTSVAKAVESVSNDNNCFGKCMLNETRLLTKIGNFNKDAFSDVLKSNATFATEIQRIQGWKLCAETIEKEAKPLGGIMTTCKFPNSFLSCGFQVEQKFRRGPGCILN